MSKWLRTGLVPQALLCTLVATGVAGAQDAATFDADGTAHVTRVIPEPALISNETRAWLDSLTHLNRGPQTLQERRASTDQWRTQDSAEALKQYPVTIRSTALADVPVDEIAPLQMPPENRNRVFINLHGGGFNSDSGSRIEGDPIANLAHTETSTRDMLLGDTTTLRRALLRQAVDARLVVFEALPHAFWYHFEFPETREALERMAHFLDSTVGH